MFHYIDEILMHPVSLPVDIIGYSREQRPVHGAVLGNGKKNISLIGGCHADEPVGPRFLRKLYSFLSSLEASHPLMRNYRWFLVPHANPDGEAVNMRWHGDGDMTFDLVNYLRYVERDLPGNDVEFSFPFGVGEAGQRPVNTAIYEFWLTAGGPFHLHASLHGMMVAAGPWFLFEREWIGRSEIMRELCREEVFKMGYRLHDVDRKGEKGFSRISKGFCTRPDSGSMREYFREKGDMDMASKFYPSSMEAVRGLGGDALTIVSEMPLFILPDLPGTMDWPNQVWDGWMARLEGWKKRILEFSPGDTNAAKKDNEETIRKEIRESGIIPMPVDHQMRLQWRFITAALEQIELETKK